MHVPVISSEKPFISSSLLGNFSLVCFCKLKEAFYVLIDGSGSVKMHKWPVMDSHPGQHFVFNWLMVSPGILLNIIDFL